MPVDFDPAWEFWTPDPEIAELVGEPAPVGFDALPFADDYRTGAKVVDGFRHGRHPRSVDADLTRLAPGIEPGIARDRLPGHFCPACAPIRCTAGRYVQLSRVVTGDLRTDRATHAANPSTPDTLGQICRTTHPALWSNQCW